MVISQQRLQCVMSKTGRPITLSRVKSSQPRTSKLSNTTASEGSQIIAQQGILTKDKLPVCIGVQSQRTHNGVQCPGKHAMDNVGSFTTAKNTQQLISTTF